MSLPQALPFESDLPEWVCDRVRGLGSDEWDDTQRLWQRVVTIAELLELYPPRSKQRRELQILIAEVTRRKKSTQTLYQRVWRTLKDGSAEPRVPTNIDFSTVRELVQHSATREEVETADRESWTLAQAKLWSRTRTRICEVKPLTLWRHLTKETAKELRKRTLPLSDAEAYEQTQQFRKLLLGFGRG